MTITKNGKKSMLPILDTKLGQKQNLEQAIVATLSFFSLYELPLSAKRIHELLLGTIATLPEIEQTLIKLAQTNKIIQSGSLFSTQPWHSQIYNANQLELTRKWALVDRYFNLLAVLPFVKNMSVINSLALGTADSDSDIDFFVITNVGKLYFVRSMIIVLFRMLGIYKTREKIKDRFCFGFFIDKQSMNLESLKLKPSDPYLVFWLANMRPVFGKRSYQTFMQENPWLRNYFPNFDFNQRLVSARTPGWPVRAIKLMLEILLWIPATLAEGFLGLIHINHTFKLAENRSLTSTTIARAHMLKLHGLDVRAEIAKRFEEGLARQTGP